MHLTTRRRVAKARRAQRIATVRSNARAVGRAFALIGVVLAVLVGRTKRRWSRAEDPCGPEGFALPSGEARVVRTSDGAELAATVAGPAGGATVVLSHCWTGARAVWAPVARELVRQGHQVVLYDQRGHGASSVGSAPLTVERLGTDLCEVLEQLEVRDAVLAGHSMGGMSAQAFAIGHPAELAARVRGIVLVSTAARAVPRPLPEAVARTALSDAALRRTGRGWRSLASVRLVVGRQPRMAHLVQARDMLHDTPEAVRLGCLVAMGHMDLREGLTGVDLPATVLVGTQDRLTPPRLARTIAARLPHARLVVLPGAGHMLPWEEPAQVVEAIAAMDAATRQAGEDHGRAELVGS
jgi:non-heme chloroperoxidase